MNSTVIGSKGLTSWKSFVESFSQTLLFGRREATTGNASAFAGYPIDSNESKAIAVVEGAFFDISLCLHDTTPNLVIFMMRTYTKHKLRKGEQKVV